jgi:hypothetical protein
MRQRQHDQGLEIAGLEVAELGVVAAHDTH